MRKPIAVGIVGYGYWGPNLARNFGKLASARLVAVCDLNADRLAHMRKHHPSSLDYQNFERMLSEAEIDAIVIATPLKSHHSLAKAALLAGKHVLIEKPMASSVAECEELIELARATNLTLMVGHTYLYSEAVRKIMEIIGNGDIGEVRYINCQRLNLGLFQQDMNVAWDLAPHDLSIILQVMGEPPEVVNCQGNAHINPEIEDVTNISLGFRNKRFATIQNSWLEPKKVRQMTFVGTRKMIVYDDLQPLEKIRIYDVRVECPPHYDSFAEFQYSYHYGDCYIPHIEQSEPLQTLCKHFIDCIAHQDPPISCGANGLAVVRVLEACENSLKANGGPVNLPVGRIVTLPSSLPPMSEAG
ncbi:MAG: Gfo/Idh/MocA family oxidoreductase [Verrucomicrobiota bacterium]